MSFGRKMLEFRAKHNLTQAQLAKIVGIAINTVQRLENEINKPTKRNSIKIENKMKEWEEKENVVQM